MCCPHHPYPTATGPMHIPAGPLSDDLPTVSPILGQLPKSLRDSMHRTIGYALDFLLDTLDFSPDEINVPLNEADLRLQPSADPMMKDMYCVVLWNGDKHTFDEVKTVVMDLTGKGNGPERQKEVDAMVKTLENDGRVIVDMNVVTPQPLSSITHGPPQQAKLLEMAHCMTQIDMGVTIRRAYDTFCEQVGAVIIDWLLDLTRARLGPDTLVLREVLARELISARKRDAFTLGMAPLSKNSPGGMVLPPSAVNLTEIPNATRLDYMFVYHSRLWRRLRLSLKEVYASLLSLSKYHKLAIGMLCFIQYSTIPLTDPSWPFRKHVSSDYGHLPPYGSRSRDLHQVLCAAAFHCPIRLGSPRQEPQSHHRAAQPSLVLLHKSNQ